LRDTSAAPRRLVVLGVLGGRAHVDHLVEEVDLRDGG